MIPDFKTYLKESTWNDIRKQSAGTVDRKEDDTYVDFGPNTTVYWSKDALEIDGRNRFYFEEMENYSHNGWRLPTVDEVKEIEHELWHIDQSWYRDDDGVGYEWLEFPHGTLRIKSEMGFDGGCRMWTKERHPRFKNCAYDFGFNNSSKFSIDTAGINSARLYVFLVKDKPKKK